MWLLTEFGFFSIVSPHEPEKRDQLLVRARQRGDLEAFAVRLTESGELDAPPAVIETPDRDYRFRLYAPKAMVTDVIATAVDDIDYTNFKARVADDNAPRAKLYEKVWSVLRAELQPAVRRVGRAFR